MFWPHKINFDTVKKIGTKANIFKNIGTKRYISFDRELFPILHNSSKKKTYFSLNFIYLLAWL